MQRKWWMPYDALPDFISKLASWRKMLPLFIFSIMWFWMNENFYFVCLLNLLLRLEQNMNARKNFYEDFALSLVFLGRDWQNAELNNLSYFLKLFRVCVYLNLIGFYILEILFTCTECNEWICFFFKVTQVKIWKHLPKAFPNH